MAALARVDAYTHACSILPHRYVLRALPACAACRARPRPATRIRSRTGTREQRFTPASGPSCPATAGRRSRGAPRARAVRRERRASGRTPPARMRIFARPREDEWTEAESRDGHRRGSSGQTRRETSSIQASIASVRSERVSGSVNLENARIQNTTFYAIHTRAALRPVTTPISKPGHACRLSCPTPRPTLSSHSTDTHLSRSHRVCRTPWGLPTTDGSDTPRDIEMLV